MNTVTVITPDGHSCPCAGSDRIGIGGVGAEIAIPGDTSTNQYAYIENHDGHPWLIPATPAITVRLGGASIYQATPLRNGDELDIGGAGYRAELSGQTLKLVGVDSGPAEDQQALPKPVQRKKSSPRRLRVFKLFLLSIFVALVLVLLFVFFATPISISVSPDPDRVAFTGFPPPVPLQGRYLVFPGDYRVSASKPGYEPLNTSVSIERGRYRDLVYELNKLPGRVSIYSQPEVAEIRVDEKYMGSTPLLQKKIPAGQHRLTVSKKRYQDAVLKLEVEGLDREQVIRVELAPDWAPVTFRSEPVGASVVFGDEIAGITPLTVDILSGDHRVNLELDRYQSRTLDMKVVAGVAMAVPVVTLVPVPGDLSLTSDPAAATVTVGDTFRGSTPLALKLAPGVDHQITLSKAGYEVVKRTVTVQAGEKRALSITFSPLFGVVFITSNPADATLSVDGKAAGRASQRLRLTTQQHTLEFSKPGYQTQRITLTPRSGVSKALSVDLKPVGQRSPVTSTPKLVRTGEGQELKLIEPGEFTMGSSRREQGRRANENLRRVVLTRPFYLAAREVTNAEYRRFKPEHRSGTAYGRSLDLENQPVVNVGWQDAASYLNWLSEQEGLPPAYRMNGEKLEPVRPQGRGYRLPTEAEWARAARFSTSESKKYAWGKTYPPTGSFENYADKSASGLLTYSLSSYNDAHPVTAPVGSFSPNEAGLYDLGGNVAEWTNDYYAVYPADAGTVTRDPVGPDSGRHHVVRGAGWKDSTISELRLSYRDYADGAREDLGFRVARYAD